MPTRCRPWSRRHGHDGPGGHLATAIDWAARRAATRWPAACSGVMVGGVKGRRISRSDKPGAPIVPVAGAGTVVRPQKGSTTCPLCWHPLNAIAATIASTSATFGELLYAKEASCGLDRVALDSLQGSRSVQQEKREKLWPRRRLAIFPDLSRRIFSTPNQNGQSQGSGLRLLGLRLCGDRLVCVRFSGNRLLCRRCLDIKGIADA